MSNRISKILALTGISAAFAIGGAGLAQASSPDHSSGHRNDHCKALHGKQRRDCERKHHHR